MNSVTNPKVASKYGNKTNINVDAFTKELNCEFAKAKHDNKIKLENAICSLKIALIKNAHWVVPIVLIFFIAFVLGLVADYIRKQITKI